MKTKKRGLLDRILGSYMRPLREATQFEFMSGGFTPTFTSFGKEAYASDVVRSAIHPFATAVAKLNPKHVRKGPGGLKPLGSNVEYLLSVRPNRFMSAFDMYYRTATQAKLKNNAFIFINRDSTGKVEGFYPIAFENVELLDYMGELYVRFTFMNGKTLAAEYNQFIHIRRHYYKNDLFGESNSEALIPTLELIHTVDEGIVNAVKSSAFLRGLIQYKAMLKDEDLKKNRDSFVKDYMDVSNNGGIAALDAKADYISLNNDPKMVDSKQMDNVERKVFNFFNTNRSIVSSDFKEEQWNAYYEMEIEPFAIQLSQEFTHKLFTEGERSHGNQIIFEANRLAYASNTTKIALLRDLAPLGLFTINEGREVFNMGPVEGGEIRIQTLNVVNAGKADQYQGVDDPSKPVKGGDEDDDEDEEQDES